MDLHISLENKNVILVDDVLFTGRTVRSAFEAYYHLEDQKKLSYSFVDRRFCRELPIQADYEDRSRYFGKWKSVCKIYQTEKSVF